EVFIMEVFQLDPRPARPLNVSGVPLRWSNLLVDGQPATRVTVPPGMPRYIDLLALRQPRTAYEGTAVQGEPAAVELQIYPMPTREVHLLGRGKYELWLAVAARDTDSAHYTVEVTFDGQWWGADDIREHLAVTKPRRERLNPPGRKTSRWLPRVRA